MKKSTRDTIIFCIICGLSATLVMIIFTVKRVDDPNSPMTKKEDNEVFQSGCQFWHLTNDQVCDDEANTEECNFDFGDCCDYQNDFTSCQECFCYSKHLINYTLIQDCSMDQDQYWDWFIFLGDGTCQLQMNNLENFFDVGDCCLNYTQCENIIKAPNLWGATVPNSFDADCPKDVCIRSDMYCIPDLMGDGVCHDNNNSELCDFDLGDCCKPNPITDSCCNCDCKQIWYRTF